MTGKDRTRLAQSRRRGRRPASVDTRNQLIEAARATFTENGYSGATVRGIAARAGVDASMINHWFGGKEKLFAEAVLQVPFQPGDFVNRAVDGPLDSLGERIIATFLRAWDSASGGALAAMLRSISANDEALELFRTLITTQVLTPITEQIDAEDAGLRATLCASQLVGLGLIRYVLRFEPLASADHHTIVSTVAPTLQHYLTGDLGLSISGNIDT